METIKRKLPAFFIILIFTLSIVLMIPGMLFAQEDEAAEMIIAEPVPEELFFETKLPKKQAKYGETFSFDFDVAYKAGDNPFGIEEGKSEKNFEIKVDYPTGWFAEVEFGSTQDVPNINLKFNSRESFRLMAAPFVKQEPGEYDLKVTFKSTVEGDTLKEESIEFTAVITATYEIVLTTKTGMLSTELTSGKDNHYKLIVTNNSSTSVENISLSSTEPEGWQVSFDKDKIESMEAGENMEIDAVINPPEKTIAGDYMLTFRASSENSNSSIDLRATVETPTIWGIVGIGIIVVVIIGVAVIFARLGRR